MPRALDGHAVPDRLRELRVRPIKSYRGTGVPACRAYDACPRRSRLWFPLLSKERVRVRFPARFFEPSSIELSEGRPNRLRKEIRPLATSRPEDDLHSSPMTSSHGAFDLLRKIPPLDPRLKLTAHRVIRLAIVRDDVRPVDNPHPRVQRRRELRRIHPRLRRRH